jgi:hypothetical protein
MGAGPDSVSLTKPASELLVEVTKAIDPEMMNVEAFGVRGGPGDPKIFHAPWEVEIPA